MDLITSMVTREPMLTREVYTMVLSWPTQEEIRDSLEMLTLWTIAEDDKICTVTKDTTGIIMVTVNRLLITMLGTLVVREVMVRVVIMVVATVLSMVDKATMVDTQEIHSLAEVVDKLEEDLDTLVDIR